MTPTHKPGDPVTRTGETVGPPWGVYQGETYTVSDITPDGYLVLEGVDGAEWHHRGFRPADEEGKT